LCGMEVSRFAQEYLIDWYPTKLGVSGTTVSQRFRCYGEPERQDGVKN